MKLRNKILTWCLSLGLLSGSLVACGETKYKVNVHADAGCNVVGINDKGYAANSNVSFTVNITDEEKELNAVTRDNITLDPVGGVYTFQMPEKDVDLEVTLKEKIKYVLSFSTAQIKIGVTSKFNLKFGDAAIPDFTLEATSGGEHVRIDNEFYEITGLSEGEVTVQALDGTNVVATKTFTVVEPQHGELPNDPLTVEQAVAICKALPTSTADDKQPSELTYYVEGVVTEVIENEDQYTNATFMMGEFEVYRLGFLAGVDRNKIEKGAEVKIYAKLLKFGSTLETEYVEGAGVVSVDNSTIRLVDLDNAVRHVQKDGSAHLKAALYPKDLAEGAAVVWEAKNADKVNFEGSGNEVTINALGAVGDSGKIVAKVGDYSAECVFKIVAEEVHGEEKDDPITAKQAIEIGKKLEKTTSNDDRKPSETFYYITDIVTEVTENSTSYGNVTGFLGDFELYRITWDKNDPDREKFVVGALIEIRCKILQFYETIENDEGRVLSCDNSKTRLLLLNESSQIMNPGHQLQLTVKAYPGGTKVEDAVWSSDKPEVASVENGLVTALGGEELDTAVISATKGDVSATCKVVVTPAGKALQKAPESEFTGGKEFYLVLKDKDNASLNRYAAAEMDSYYVKSVSDFSQAAKVTLVPSNDASYPWKMKVGEYTVSYYNADGHDNIYLSTDEDLAEKPAALLKYGEYTAKDGNKYNGWIAKTENANEVMVLGNSNSSSDAGTNTIRFNKAGYISRQVDLYSFQTAKPVTAIKLDEAATVTVNKKLTLSVSVEPTEGTLFDPRKVTWSSENEAIATVDQKGVVTAVAIGETNIVARYEGVDTPAKCKVTVKAYEAFSSTTDFTKMDPETLGKTEVTDMAKVKTALNNADITSITASKIYAAQTEQGPGIKGLKIGTTSAGGNVSIKFVKSFSKITLTVRAWSADKLAKVTVNGQEYQLEAADASANRTLVITLEGETDTVQISATIAAVFQSMVVETVE